MAKIDRILRAVESTRWAIMPEKLVVIGEVLSARAEAGAFPNAEEIQAVEARQHGKVVSGGGGIAVLPLYGTLARRMGMLEAMSGGTSVETFSQNFAELVSDDSISDIVIVVDSPGGSVYGIDELASQIFEARSKKRIIAIADSLMASAAYYIGSAATELVVTPSGEVGSIGVYSIHFDLSEHLEDDGINVSIIKAGDRKAEGNPYEALGEDAAAHMQLLIDQYYRKFLNAVARGRGVSVATVEEDFGQGLTFTAELALERNMVDRIATLDDVLADLTQGSQTQKKRVGEEIRPALAVASESHPSLAEFGATSVGTIGETARELTDTLRKMAKGVRIDVSKEDTDAATGHAAEEIESAPTKPAHVAKEDPMSDKDTAAHSAEAGAIEDAVSEARAEARAAEEVRTRELTGVARDFSVDETTLDGWLKDSVSVDAAKAQVLEGFRDADGRVPAIRVGDDRESLEPYGSFGEQLQAIAVAAKNPELTDKKLFGLNDAYARAAAATGASAAVPSDGGFVIQPTFAEGITSKMWEEGRVLSRTNRVPIGENSNQLVRNMIKEASRKDGSRYGGVRVYRRDEADTVTASKQKLAQQRIVLEGLMAVFYATEEIMQDAVALTAEAETGFRKELTFVAENEIFRGTGAGQCLGFLNSNAVLEVAKESAQVALTVNATNVAKMMSRLPAGSFPTAAWFIHSSVIPQLVLMTIANQPVFLPGGNLVAAPFGTLFGMPVMPVEYCATAGTVGDIILADLQQYTTIDKRGATWQESIHVRFLYDENTFKLTYRFNGQPDWEDKVAEFQGFDSLSPFITLAARA